MRLLLLAVAAALAWVPAAQSQNRAPGDLPPWGNRNARPTSYPTGVVTSKVPDRPGVIAHGPVANAFIASALAPQDPNDDKLGSGEEPWLVLVGPPDATKQAADQIPADVEPRIRVTHVDPSTDAGKLKIRDWKMKAGGKGTKALVMEPDGTVHYEGVFDLRDVVAKLRELLGLEGDDEDDDGGWFPNPLRPRIEVSMPNWLVLLIGVALGFGATMIAPAIRFLRLLVLAAKSLADRQQPPAPRPN